MACTIAAPPACSGACKKDKLELYKSVTVVGDFALAGIGTRNTGSGTIDFNSLPPGVTVKEAYLYWNTFVPNNYSGDDMVSFSGPYGAGVETGSLIGFCGPTCWQNEVNMFNRIYRSDIGPTGSNRFGGNGAFTISGLPFDATGIIGPDGSRVPNCQASQGAVILVIYEYPNANFGPTVTFARERTILIYDGGARVVSPGPNQSTYGGQTSYSLFVASNKIGAPKVGFGIGDAQIWTDSISINGQSIGTAGPNVGFDLYAELNPSPCAIRAENTIKLESQGSNGDCLSWFLFVMSGYEKTDTSQTCEYLANCASVKTVGDYSASDTLIVVDSNEGMPLSTPFRVKVGNELILVKSGPPSSVMWTVERGVENTTPAGILSGSCVRQLLTVAGFYKLFNCRSNSGERNERCDGGSWWANWGSWWFSWWWANFNYWYNWSYQWQSAYDWEQQGNWNWQNQGSTAFDTSNGGAWMQNSGTGSTNVHFRTKNLSNFATSSPPYAFSAGFQAALSQGNSVGAGIGLREQATGKFIYFSMQYDDSSFGKNDTVLSIDKYDDATTFNSNYAKIPADTQGKYAWLRALDKDGNLTFSYSNDGKNYNEAFSTSRTNFLAGGPDQVLYGIKSNSGNVGMTTHSLSVVDGL